MADAGTRLCVGIVGTSTIGRIRVNLGAEETVVRAELVTKAAKKLCVRPQGPCGARAHEGPRAVVVHRQDQALRRLRSVQEGMPLSQLPRQVYQEGDRQCAGGRAATRRWSSRRPITGATSGGSYSSRRRRERASWTVGVSCGVCAVQERSASALVRWPMPIGHMPHTPDTARFAKKSRLRTQLFNFRNWLS
jgi:hypothetical protein